MSYCSHRKDNKSYSINYVFLKYNVPSEMSVTVISAIVVVSWVREGR